MTTTNDTTPVEVPASYIKNKPVDYDGEIFAAMGGCLPCGDFLVKPPSLGVFSLLETYESDFIAHPEECSVMEFWRVLYINEHRRDCVQDVMAWAYPDKGKHFDTDDNTTWQTFDWAVYEWGNERRFGYEEDISEAYLAVHKWFNISFEGFAMIPGGGSGGECWFGAESIGGMSVSTGYKIEEILWDVSMAALGHCIAALCRQNGNDHVKRPKDKEDLAKQIAEAKRRIKDGELHPWQIDHPKQWPLTKEQKDKHPRLVDEFNRNAKEKASGKS